MQNIRWTLNHMPAGEDRWLSLMSPGQVAQAKAFHAGFPEYRPTPLHSLRAMAKELGLGGLYIKDESKRFGLNAFKVLGGSYAIARYAAERTGCPPEAMTFAALTGTAAAKVKTANGTVALYAGMMNVGEVVDATYADAVIINTAGTTALTADSIKGKAITGIAYVSDGALKVLVVNSIA